LSDIASPAQAAQGSRAGIVTRFIADAIDFVVALGLLFATYLVVAGIRFLIRPRDFRWPTPEAGVIGALGWGLLILYLAVGWATTGRTVGKQLMGLRVVNRHADRLHFGTALLRALICAVFPLGLFWCAVSRQNRSVADLLLRTSVVYDWGHRTRAHERDPDAVRVA
jgi:uncharacterized RDD family membrane protein YckC